MPEQHEIDYQEAVEAQAKAVADAIDDEVYRRYAVAIKVVADAIKKAKADAKR